MAIVQEAEDEMVTAFYRCSESVNSICREWWMVWGAKIEESSTSFSSVVFNYFDPNADFVDEAWFPSRMSKLSDEVFWEASKAFPMVNGHVSPLGIVSPEGRWEEYGDRRETLMAHIDSIRKVLVSIRDDLKGVVLAAEYEAKRADKEIVNNWLRTDRLIEQQIDTLSVSISHHLSAIEAVSR